MMNRTLLLFLLLTFNCAAFANGRILKLSQFYGDLDYIGQLKLEAGEQKFPFRGITHNWECKVINSRTKPSIMINCKVRNGEGSISSGSLVYCDSIDTFTVDAVDFQCLEK